MCGILFLQDSVKTADPRTFVLELWAASVALEHRGQDGFGILDDCFNLTRQFGEIRLFFRNQENFDRLVANALYRYLIHLRYSTSGGANDIVSYQPHVRQFRGEPVAFAANGDTPDMPGMLAMIDRETGLIRESDNDGEMMLLWVLHIMQQRQCPWIEALQAVIAESQGAFSGAFMTKESAFIIRDRAGIRPLIWGKKGSRIMVASETCALETVGYEFCGEVEPGQIIEIANDGHVMHHKNPQRAHPRRGCIVESIYFSRPDSRFVIPDIPFCELLELCSLRAKFGKRVMREHPVDADMLTGVPRSGYPAWMGAHHESHIEPYILLLANPVGRTFISKDEERIFLMRLKYQIMRSPFRKYKRVVVIDDSLIRGTTIKYIVQMMRNAGAEEIHWYVTFPPVIATCDWGINIKTEEELFARGKTIAEIEQELGLDSIGYLSIEGLAEVLKECGDDIANYCTHCITGKKPFEV